MAVSALRVINGPNWDSSRQRREQRAWDEHATFMEGLVAGGFVILGGPIGNSQQVLLVVEAVDPDEIEARLSRDPWVPIGLLRIGAIEPWTIWLDGKRSKA